MRSTLITIFMSDLLMQINTIAAVRLSAAEGHTVILNQTDAIHESFYDLFNRRFHRIDSENGPRFYANIAIGAHIKPCRIHPNFECIVVVKESDLATTPPPFLNRFEKYFLSYKTLLEAMLQKLPSCLRTVIETAQFKVKLNFCMHKFPLCVCVRLTCSSTLCVHFCSYF